MLTSRSLPQFLPIAAPRWSVLSWSRTHLWTILATIILSMHAVPILLKQHSEWNEVYVRAASRLLHGGDVYRFEDGYSYPPFMAWMAIPFTVLPATLSRMVWFGINVSCLIIMWRLAWRMTGGGQLEGVQASDSREHLVCFLGLACSVRYALNGLAHQQTDVVISALLLFGCWMLSKNRDWRATTCFGLAAAMKCTALLWIPYLLWRRKWAAAAWLIVIAIGVNLFPNLVRAPPETGGLWLGEWLTHYIRPLTAGDHYPGDWGSWIIYNQSLSGAGNRWLTTKWSWHGSELEVIRRSDATGPMTVKSVVYGTESALIATVAFIVIRRRAVGWAESSMPTRTKVESDVAKVGLEDSTHPTNSNPLEMMEYCVVLLLMVLLSPMSSKPHFSTLVLPGFALARFALYQGDKILRCLLTLSVVLATLSLPLWGGRLSFVALWLGSDTWNALVLLLGLIYVLLANRSFSFSSRRPFDIPLLPCHHGLKQPG
jgi:hypothetical protein